MAKPILVVTITDKTPRAIQQRIWDILDKKLSYDYHVLLITNPNIRAGEQKFECFNDCKGLPDKDITELINSIKELYNERTTDKTGSAKVDK